MDLALSRNDLDEYMIAKADQDRDNREEFRIQSALASGQHIPDLTPANSNPLPTIAKFYGDENDYAKVEAYRESKRAEKAAGISGSATVSDRPWVYGNAIVSGYATVKAPAVKAAAPTSDEVYSPTYGNMRLPGSGLPLDGGPKNSSPLYGEMLTNPGEKQFLEAALPIISGDAKVYNSSAVSGDAKVYNSSAVSGDAKVYNILPDLKPSRKAKPKASDEDKAKAKWFGWK